MKATRKSRKTGTRISDPVFIPEPGHHGRIFSAPQQDSCLDSAQLGHLEQSFREWTAAAIRPDVHVSRQRVLLIFLLIRYTGAKIGEVLGLDPMRDIDFDEKSVTLGRVHDGSGHHQRRVHISETLCNEIRALLADPRVKRRTQNLLGVDPGFVRRKFYERAEACGMAKQLGAPEVLRKSRAVELMQNNMPLPAVQMLLGHSTPNLTSAYVSFSEDEIRQVTRLFVERESKRRTSARNTFYGRIQVIRKGDIQSRVELETVGGQRLATVITNSSLQRLGLKKGRLITAEVKAPWVLMQKGGTGNETSADNRFRGTVSRITRGEINSEYVMRMSDGTELCSVATSLGGSGLGLERGDEVWAVFNAYAVVLLSE